MSEHWTSGWEKWRMCIKSECLTIYVGFGLVVQYKDAIKLMYTVLAY